MDFAQQVEFYPDGAGMASDGEREAARPLSADRIMLQFPDR